MIPVQTIVDRCLALLDAEDSDRYTWDNDFQYAIGAAIEYTVALYNQAFANNKLSEESMRELTYNRCFQTSLYSRVAFDPTDMGMSVWSILAVYPKIQCIFNDTLYGVDELTLPAATVESVYRDDISFRKSNYSCKRLTAEQWAAKERNSFMAGSPWQTCEALMEYGYLNPTNYVGGYTLSNDEFEIEIAPEIPGELVAVSFLKLPTKPTTINDDIEFPQDITNLIVSLSMRFIGIKQGELPTFKVAEQDIATLVGLTS